MRIGLAVDALAPELTGIGRYCWELAQRLPASGRLEDISFWRGNDRVSRPADLVQGIAPARPSRPWIVRRARRLALRLGLRDERADWPKRPGFDAFHAPNFLLPPWVERGVVTVHDLSVIRFPETHPPERVRAHAEQFADTLRRASHVITPSRTVRDEFLRFSGFAEHRVIAVPMGIAAHYRTWPPELRNPVLQRLGLPTGGYGLTVSALEPRKRIDRLIAAWRLLPTALRDRCPLVIAGAPGWMNADLRAQIDQAAGEGWLIPLGYVAESDMPALYSGAAVFSYPSLYEGFGMPPIEAMASGVPTVVASSSCLPEVTAGAAMLVDPEDIDGFAHALEQSLTDESWRTASIARGLTVAGGYTWEATVAATLDVYGRALAA